MGFLDPGDPVPWPAFWQGLRDLGYVEGTHLILLVMPLVAGAQQPGEIPRIGILGFARADDQRAQYFRELYRQGLREFGWVEGQNITILTFPLCCSDQDSCGLRRKSP